MKFKQTANTIWDTEGYRIRFGALSGFQASTTDGMILGMYPTFVNAKKGCKLYKRYEEANSKLEEGGK